jgi:hypothetical protein
MNRKLSALSFLLVLNAKPSPLLYGPLFMRIEVELPRHKTASKSPPGQ